MKVTPEMTVDAIARVLASKVARDEALGPDVDREPPFGLYERGFHDAVERVGLAVAPLLPPGESPEAWTARIMSTRSQDV